jgi:hypothetical protein
MFVKVVAKQQRLGGTLPKILGANSRISTVLFQMTKTLDMELYFYQQTSSLVWEKANELHMFHCFPHNFLLKQK